MALERRLAMCPGWRMNSPRASQPRTCETIVQIAKPMCALALVQNKAVSRWERQRRQGVETYRVPPDAAIQSRRAPACPAGALLTFRPASSRNFEAALEFNKHAERDRNHTVPSCRTSPMHGGQSHAGASRLSSSCRNGPIRLSLSCDANLAHSLKAKHFRRGTSRAPER